jgi:hypothetical protein
MHLKTHNCSSRGYGETNSYYGDGSSYGYGREAEGKTCQICHQHDASVRCVPCGHQYSCVACILKAATEKKTCKICFKGVEQAVVVLMDGRKWSCIR